MAWEEDYSYICEGDDFDEYKVTCKYCGEGNLRWEQINDKWVLMELDLNMKEHQHKCKRS